MYSEFYKIKEPPFNNVPDLRYFFNSAPYDESLKRILDYIKNGKRLLTVIGGCGLGKTIISRKILFTFEDDSESYETNLMVCLHSDMEAGWILKRLAIQLHLDITDESKNALFEQVTKKFIELAEKGKHNIFLIDEANMIENRDVMEEIRALIDFMADYDYKFSVVFFGLPIMEGKLATDEPLYHRVEARVVLKPLPTTDAVKKYIEHRLKIAGAIREVFSDEAYHAIYLSTRGNPRLVNIVCDNALTEGYLSKERIVGQKEVDRIIVDMGYNTRLKSLFLDSSKDESPA